MYSYHDPAVAKILVTAKYKFLPEIFTMLGKELAGFVANEFPLPEATIIAPLPLTPKRLRWRGFNQAQIIAETLAGELKLNWANALQKIQNTKPQKELSREGRMQNMSGVFIVSPYMKINKTPILLIDDIITTGATLREAVATLKATGAKTVWCITLAQD